MKNHNFLKKDLSIVESIIFNLEPEFVSYLTDNYPVLTENEMKICILIKNNFTNEEIARYLSIFEYEVKKVIKVINNKLKKNYSISIKNLLNQTK